jgi:hypothetical protein
MTGKAKQPGGDPASTETPQPGQQMAGDGSLEGAETFGNIDPEGDPRNDELGGG